MQDDPVLQALLVMATKDTRESKGRVAAYRARLRALGLRPLEIWARPEHHQRIKDFAKTLDLPDPNAGPSNPSS